MKQYNGSFAWYDWWKKQQTREHFKTKTMDSILRVKAGLPLHEDEKPPLSPPEKQIDGSSLVSIIFWGLVGVVVVVVLIAWWVS